MPSINPGPASAGNPNTQIALAATGISNAPYTYASLPVASSIQVGTQVFTTDQGMVYTNGVSWIVLAPATYNSVPAKYNIQRPPAVTDNATLGFTTNSVWQYAGTIYTTSAYCASDSAAWTALNLSPIGTPADVMGTTLTKFAGGTCAMLKGYTGAAVDVAITAGGVYQIYTVNILATGELDNVSMGAVMATADAATNAKVLKVYDQSGNSNHATLANAAGIAVSAASATVTTGTTLTINSGQTGTIAAGQTVYGSGIPPGITVASGAGPYTLSGAGAPANPAAIAVYFGITSPPYIDWDPVLGRYAIYSPNEQTNGGTTNKRALQLPQAATFTNANNVGVYAVGVGTNSSDISQPCLCAIGDSSVGSGFYQAIFGGTGGAQNLNGQLIVTQNGTAHTLPVAIKNQPCVLIASSAATPLMTLNVNEDQGTNNAAITSQAVAGGWIFSYGGSAIIPYGMMKFVGLAMFNAAPTAAQSQAMRYGAYCRFNIFPQVINQIALVGDSRLANFNVTPGFGVSNILPRYVGRNWDLINLSTHSQMVLTQIGDGLVPTVTGLAKSLQTFKKPGLNYAVILGSVNDFSQVSASVAQAFSYLQTLCAQIVAAGWVPILIAELTTTSVTGNANTQLPLLNAAIVAAGSAAFSGAQIVNLYGYVPVVTPGNANYYYTGLHPTPAVHQIIASAVAVTITTPYP